MGKYVKVRVNFTDNVGNQETLTSAATVAVEASPNRPPKGVLHLNGIAEVGQELSVFGLGFWGRGIWDDNGLMYGSFNYQWIRNDGTTDFDIPGATSSDPNTGPLPYISTVGTSYTLTDADEGQTIKVRLSFTDDGGNVETLTSTETTAVTARPSTSDLGEPTALTVEWSQGEEKGLDLSWTAPEGTVTSYQILRLEIPTRSRWWEPYPYGCTPLMEVHVSDTGGGATAYTDTDVAEGASYTYSVRALNSDGVGRKSASPRSLQYRPPHTPTSSYWPSGVPGTPYRVPTNLASRQIKNGIGLTWEAPEGEVTGYQILRRSPEQCDYGYRVYVENTNSTDTHWADRNVVAGTRYEYHVRAVNDVGAGRLDRSISTSLRPTTLVVGPEPNNPATGTPTITGTAQVGETLTADPSGIADADGMHWSRFSYQWRSSRDTEIEGATGPTYRIETSDANKLIKVRVEFMDDSGYEESLTSAATAAVSPNISATGAPAITGTAEVGGTLTADTSGIVDLDGLDNVSYSYQWIHSDGTAAGGNNTVPFRLVTTDGSVDLEIDGATTATYQVTAADVDKAIKLRVNFTDDKGSVESLTSSATAVVPVETAFTFSLDGTAVACDSYNVHVVNVPYQECDDPSSIDQGTSGEIEVEIEITRSVNSQLYKFEFHVYQMEDRIGHYNTVEANDLCLGPGLVDSVSMEVTPDDGSGNFTYTDEGTIFKLCPAGTYQLYVPWYRYNYEDQEYEYAGTFRRHFFINGDDEEDTSVEQVKFITASYPDTPVSHGEVQIQGTKQSTTLNRTLTTFALSIDGLVPDSDTETTDYVVRVRIVGDGGPGKTVPWCHVGNVGYSYLLKTVPKDGRWEMDAHVLGNCLDHWWPDTLQVELFNGTDLTDYSTPVVFHGSNIISHTGELQYPEYGTHEFIAGEDISLGELPNSPATGAPTISGTPQVGETLTVNTSGIADANGMDHVSFSYQWLSSRDTEIDGATNSTYTLVSTDVGKIIKVKVTFTDDAQNEETLTSAGTEAVTAKANSPATGAPTISGTAQVGETLTANTSGIADADGLSEVQYAYQWLADGADISGATGSTYTLTGAEVGKAVKVGVSFTDDANNQEELTSEATGSVEGTTTAPGQPDHLRVFPHDAQGLDLSWEAPVSDGGSSVTGYKVQWKQASGRWDTAEDVSEETVSGTTYTINGLTDGVEYTVRVIAVNAVGDGTPSAEAMETPRETVPPQFETPEVDGETLTLTYDEALDRDSVPPTTAFRVTVAKVERAVDRVSVSGSVVTLTLASAVAQGETVVVSYTLPADESAPRIRDLAGNAAAGFDSTEAFNFTEETTPPQLDTARVDGETLTLTYDEALDGDSVPAVDAFTVEVETVERGVDGVSVAGSVVTLTLASAVAFGDTVTVSYTAPPGESSTGIQDSVGNVAPSFSGQAVVNDTKPPVTVSARNKPTSHDGTNDFTFEIRFSEEPRADFSYKTLRDHAFNVSGGSVQKAHRLQKEPESNIGWKITVRPDGNGDVTVVLPITTDCESTGAICTGDGRMLSNRLEFTVSGPGG